MSWIKNKVRNWLSNVEPNRLVGTHYDTLKVNHLSQLPNNTALQFTVYDAIGGKILEFRKYNKQYDRDDGARYIIADTDDLPKRVANILLLETMKD